MIPFDLVAMSLRKNEKAKIERAVNQQPSDALNFGRMALARCEHSSALQLAGLPALCVGMLLVLLFAGCSPVKLAQKPPADIGHIEATITVSRLGQMAFPELTAPRPPGIDRLLSRTTSNGVVFSGGGTRSQIAVTGQLRALHAMGLIDNIRYITAVSGATWAAAPFFYYRDGPSTDDEFLGPVVTPDQRRNWAFVDTSGESWATLSPNFVGHTATQSFEKPFFAFFLPGRAHKAWQHATGEVYFKPFGLYEPDQPRFFSFDDDSVRDILKRHEVLQPAWSAKNFVTVRPNRPYLIMTATILWPADLTDHIQKVLIELSPLGVGNPQFLNLEDTRLFRKFTQPTGGGFVDPFAFQSFGPDLPVEVLPAGSKLVKIPTPEEPLTLWQASGMSSAAYAASLARVNPLVLPKATYWSPAKAGESPTSIVRFGDGGNLEDLGIMPLLQRKVRKIVAFANYFYSLKELMQGAQDGDEKGRLIAPLFGWNTKHSLNNQVFARSDFQPLLESLKEVQDRGDLPIAKKTYQVLANPWFGIEPYEVEILWIYNDVSENWVKQLNPEVAAIVREGVQGKGELKDFPHYRTIAENGMHFVELTPQQVTLLADMFSWSMQQPKAKELIEYMLAPPR